MTGGGGPSSPRAAGSPARRRDANILHPKGHQAAGPKVTRPRGQTWPGVSDSAQRLNPAFPSSVGVIYGLWKCPPPSLTDCWALVVGGPTSSCPLSHMSKAHVLCPMSRRCWWKRAERGRTGDFREDVSTLLYGINENISLPYSPNEARLRKGAKNNPESFSGAAEKLQPKRRAGSLTYFLNKIGIEM